MLKEGGSIILSGNPALSFPLVIFQTTIPVSIIPQIMMGRSPLNFYFLSTDIRSFCRYRV